MAISASWEKPLLPAAGAAAASGEDHALWGSMGIFSESYLCSSFSWHYQIPKQGLDCESPPQEPEVHAEAQIAV